jgi:hypothetical protein
MKPRLAVAVAILLLAVAPASAHRLDEYLQATTIALEKDRVQAQLRLTPGVAVFRRVLSIIDTDADGIISEAEQQAYATRVLDDLSLTIDGNHLRLELVSVNYPSLDEMKEGRGEIQLEFTAGVPGGGPDRRLIFENHHQSRIAAYLVNCLVPRDPDIRITAQNRNYRQSFYQLDYVQADGQASLIQPDVRSAPPSSAWWSGAWGWFGVVGLLLFTGAAFAWRRRLQ